MRIMEVVVVVVGAIESVYGVLVVRMVGYLEVPCRVLLLWSGGS